MMENNNNNNNSINVFICDEDLPKNVLHKDQYIESFANDMMNSRKTRNSHNVYQGWYNCGGLALNVFNWVVPYTRTDELYFFDSAMDDEYTDVDREDLMCALHEEGWSENEIEEEILERDVQFLLDHYPFLERVNLEDCAPTDTVIAYRLFVEFYDDYVYDTDFHFKVRINGFWFEKLGGNKVTLTQLIPDQPWDYPGNCAYTSPIVYFIRRDANEA